MFDLEHIDAENHTPWSIGALVLAASAVGWLAYALGSEVVTGRVPPEWPVWIAAGAFAVVLFVGMAFESAGPEYAGYCDCCGERLTVQSTADGADHYVSLRVTHTPDRLHVGPVSIALRPDQQDRQYCSIECARNDPAREELVSPTGYDALRTPDDTELVVEPDSDGGSDTSTGVGD